MNSEFKNFILIKLKEINFMIRQIEDITSLNGLNSKGDTAYIALVGMRSAYQEMLEHLESNNANKTHRPRF